MSERLGEPQAIAAEVHDDKPSHPSQVGQSPSPGGELAALLARVEGATGPDRALDGDIAWSLGDYDPFYRDQPAFVREWCKPTTASLDAALALVERSKPDWVGMVNIAIVGKSAQASLQAEAACDDRCSQACGQSPPLALLAALLRALVHSGVAQ